LRAILDRAAAAQARVETTLDRLDDLVAELRVAVAQAERQLAELEAGAAPIVDNCA
jgi:F0F1-type ATP synthase membrane subunit b/b'